MPQLAKRSCMCLCVLATLALLSVASTRAQPPAVTLQVRVFDGVDEVTADTKITAYVTGDRTSALVATFASESHSLELQPGIYDLQITRDEIDDTASVKWYKHLWIQHYPDQLAGHLEVLNLQAVFGTLLVRPPKGWLDNGRPWHVGAFLTEGEGRSGFEPIESEEQRLFILPAGHYDMRARQGAWELTREAVEVPAGRTRLIHLIP